MINILITIESEKSGRVGYKESKDIDYSLVLRDSSDAPSNYYHQNKGEIL